MTITKLDLSGLKCPLPALKTRKALKSLTPGDRLEVRCTDPLAVIDIPHLVGVTGDRLEIIVRSERDTVFRIEKSAPTLASKPPLCWSCRAFRAAVAGRTEGNRTAARHAST
jgi:tRNA 2-thiouridine synthesizing protein A